MSAKDVDDVDVLAVKICTRSSRRNKTNLQSKDTRANTVRLPSDHPQTHSIADAIAQDVALTHAADDAGEALTTTLSETNIDPTDTTASTTSKSPSSTKNIQRVSNSCMYVFGVILAI